MLKRTFDIFFSLSLLILLFPLLAVISIFIVMESKGGMLFRQKRVGKNNRDFTILKFRTMYDGSETKGYLSEGKNDSRVTRTGNFLRKYKLDEIPQLINVLAGDMSIVGPRPEVRKYVALYNNQQLKVLNVKPGITEFASIEFANENEILDKYSDKEKVYTVEIMPKKLKLNLDYIQKQSFLTDLKIILFTLKKILPQSPFFLFGSLLICIGLPFNHLIVSIGTILLTISLFFEARFKASNLNGKMWVVIILFLSYYFFNLLSFAWSDNMETLMQNIQIKLPLVIFPIVIFLINPSKKNIDNFFITHVVVNIFISIYCLAYHYFQASKIVFDNQLSVFLSSIYFGLNLAISICFLTYHIIENWLSNSNGVNGFKISIVLYLIFFMMLVQARGAVASVMMLYCLGIFYLVSVKRKFKLGILLITFFVLTGSGYYYFSPNAQIRIQSIPVDIKSFLKRENNHSSSTTYRLIFWESAVKVFSENLIFGAGKGDFKSLIKKSYFEIYPDLKNHYILNKKDYNAHNQFMESAASIGIIGVLIHLLIFIYPIFIAYHNRNYFFIAIALTFIFLMFTESILERQIGATSFAFFYVISFARNCNLSEVISQK